VLNTNTATAVALLVWTLMDKMAYGKPSVIGAVNGMIAGLVAITPAAGYVDGLGAIIIGVAAGIIPWLSMNKLQKTKLMMKVDDTLAVFSTHGIAGVTGGLLVGILANPAMLLYIGTDKEAPGVNVRLAPVIRLILDRTSSCSALRTAIIFWRSSSLNAAISSLLITPACTPTVPVCSMVCLRL
jgi:ammonia channel protein AmtB